MNKIEWEDKLTQQIPGLRRYARALTQNLSSADDLVQDCLERAWNKRDSWAEGSNLRAWLFTLMHNLFVNGVRRQKLHQNYLIESAINPPQPNNGPNTAIHDLKNCLTKLKPELREVVLLAGLENLSYKEIAQITGSPIGTVMSRLSRGREQLHQLMSGSIKPKLVTVK